MFPASTVLYRWHSDILEELKTEADSAKILNYRNEQMYQVNRMLRGDEI
jgi:hypothetical protein